MRVAIHLDDEGGRIGSAGIGSANHRRRSGIGHAATCGNARMTGENGLPHP
ncbi:MAG TPA: hypothetical protein VMP12_01870 [Candidatus Sulfotelmatobacter sp.]|nr:hypothetical protein [Candidatus Sulfotelmatobacter sp.]